MRARAHARARARARARVRVRVRVRVHVRVRVRVRVRWDNVKQTGRSSEQVFQRILKRDRDILKTCVT